MCVFILSSTSTPHRINYKKFSSALRARFILSPSSYRCMGMRLGGSSERDRDVTSKAAVGTPEPQHGSFR